MLRIISNRLKKLSTLTVILLTVMLTACSTGVQYNEGASNANVRLAIEYLKLGNGPGAKQSLMMALKEDPKSEAAWYSMGYFYEATGNEQTAEYYYKQAIKRNLVSGVPNNNYGTFLCRRGRYQAAIQQFLIAAKNPQYINVGQAYENAGLCALLIPNQKLAQTYFIKALRNNPSLGDALLEFAKIQYSEGHPKKAKLLYKRFIHVSKPTGESKQFAALLYDNIQPKRLAIPMPRRTKRTFIASNAGGKKAPRSSTKSHLVSKQNTHKIDRPSPARTKPRLAKKQRTRKIHRALPTRTMPLLTSTHHFYYKQINPVSIPMKLGLRSKQAVVEVAQTSHSRVKPRLAKRQRSRKIHRSHATLTIPLQKSKQAVIKIAQPSSARRKPRIVRKQLVKKIHSKSPVYSIPLLTSHFPDKKIIPYLSIVSRPMLGSKQTTINIDQYSPTRAKPRLAKKQRVRKIYHPIATRTIPWQSAKALRRIKRPLHARRTPRPSGKQHTHKIRRSLPADKIPLLTSKQPNNAVDEYLPGLPKPQKTKRQTYKIIHPHSRAHAETRQARKRIPKSTT